MLLPDVSLVCSVLLLNLVDPEGSNEDYQKVQQTNLRVFVVMTHCQVHRRRSWGFMSSDARSNQQPIISPPF